MNNDRETLLKLVTTKMPYGRFKGTPIAELPVSYLEWFQRKGFPSGSLGALLSIAHTIKSNGLDELLHNLKHIAKDG